MNLSDIHRQAALNLFNNAYFSPCHRLLYVATPKVACTKFKWWLAELLGVKEAIEQSTNSMESDPELVIHDSFARVTPEFTGANETGLSEALSSPDYFRFCLVRNPFTRIFSAWQSKWLLGEPLQARFYQGMEGRAVVESAADIRNSFEGFLRFLDSVAGEEDWDVHVTPQVLLLEPERIAYQIMAHIEDPSALLQMLAAQVGPGFRDPLSGTRANVSLLPYSASWISDESAELIRTLYARDFEVFGYDTAVPTGAAALSDDALAMALRSIKLIRGRNVRIGELAERLSVAPKAPDNDLPVQFTLQMYWADHQDGMPAPFTEAHSKFEVYQPDGERKTIRLTFNGLQQSLARVRLDLANQPLALLLHALTLESADGIVLWQWSGKQDTLRKSLGMVFRDHPEGMTALSLSTDPQFELAIPEEVLGQVGNGACLVVEMTARPLAEGCADVIRTDEQRIADLRAAVAGNTTVGTAAISGETPLLRIPDLSSELENVANMLKRTLEQRDQTIAEQSMRFAAMRDELLRAEAQLDLLKDVMLGSREEDRL